MHSEREHLMSREISWETPHELHVHVSVHDGITKICLLLNTCACVDTLWTGSSDGDKDGTDVMGLHILTLILLAPRAQMRA
jgi:hypothetical protein